MLATVSKSIMCRKPEAHTPITLLIRTAYITMLGFTADHSFIITVIKMIIIKVIVMIIIIIKIMLLVTVEYT